MTALVADAATLEPIAARAWPAAETASIGGWRLYASSGYSGRINACWPLAPPGMQLHRAIGAVEAWYQARRLPPLFKIIDDARGSSALTGRLSELGYEARTETLMMISPAGGLEDAAVALSDTVDGGFEAVFAAAGSPDPGDAAERLQALGRMPRPRVFARLEQESAPAAIGACAAQGEWAGIFAMRTDVARRRQGLARRILASLTAWAHGAGALAVYLQVETENDAALRLYRQTGFEEAYRYRYWQRPRILTLEHDK